MHQPLSGYVSCNHGTPIETTALAVCLMNGIYRARPQGSGVRIAGRSLSCRGLLTRAVEPTARVRLPHELSGSATRSGKLLVEASLAIDMMLGD